MKKIILGVILLIMIGGLLTSSYFIAKGNKGSNITASKIVDNVNWENAESFDLTLTKSTSITKGGVYTITGSISDGELLINTNDEVKLILNNVTIKNSNGPAIYIENSKCTYIELVGENVIEGIVNEELDSVLKSQDDLYLSGDGSLKVISNLDGISSSDNLTINGGTYIIETEDDGIKGKDSLVIENGNFTINSSGDAIKTTNEEELGNLSIENGTFNITTDGDGIVSVNSLEIKNGEYTIKTNKSNSNNSQKGLKAEGNLTIDGGTYTINTNDDGIHSNSDITINNGKITITSNDDSIHADGKLEINDGTIDLNAHEGLEATFVKINGGIINITASDDGINAGNKSNNYAPTIEINGGNITINMGQGDTDGIDSNGNIYINGGTVNITGQSPFDYDGEAKYTAGTIIVNGQTTNTITNQMMGGGGMNGGMPNGQTSNGNEQAPNSNQRPNGGNRRR